jgi:hypothetical protein
MTKANTLRSETLKLLGVDTFNELTKLLKTLTPDQLAATRRAILYLVRLAEGKKPHRYNQPELRIIKGGAL